MKLREIEVSEVARRMKEAKTASELRWWQIINVLKKSDLDVKKAAEINNRLLLKLKYLTRNCEYLQVS